MKYYCMLIGGCSVGLAAANLIGYDLSDTDMDSILQARTMDSYLDLLPRSIRLQQHLSGAGQGGSTLRSGLTRLAPPRQSPYSRSGPPRRQGYSPGRAASPEKAESSSKSDSSSSNGASIKAEPTAGPESSDKAEVSSQTAGKAKAGSKVEKPKDYQAATASIHAKGSASLHVMSAAEYRDAYNPYRKEGKMEIEHYHKVLAAGAVQGTPGTPIPDAAKLSPSEHPLIAKGRARAVSARVQAPRGGAGHIKIETPDKSEEFSVPGGSTETRTGLARNGKKAHVTASVTDGGHVRVIGGPSKKSLDEFPIK